MLYAAVLKAARAPECLLSFLRPGKQLCCERAQDSTYKYFEVVLVDIAHTAIRKVCFRASCCLRTYAVCAARWWPGHRHITPHSSASAGAPVDRRASQAGPLTVLHGGAGPAHKLDCGPRAQAPRAARPDERREEVPRPSAPRACCQQDPPIAPRDVEAEPAAVAQALPLSAPAAVCGSVMFRAGYVLVRQ